MGKVLRNFEVDIIRIITGTGQKLILEHYLVTLPCNPCFLVLLLLALHHRVTTK